MKLPIYMDNHASTPCDPQVVEKMLPYFSQYFGNSSSQSHAIGKKSAQAVDEARFQVANLINARPKEIIFTSGATEADNLAILGVARAYENKGGHIITGPTEHHAVLNTCKFLESQGFRVTYLPVDSMGQVQSKDVEKAIEKETILISLMYANNEIGTIHPIEEIGKIAKKHGVIFHCDAAQGVGKVAIRVEPMGIQKNDSLETCM